MTKILALTIRPVEGPDSRYRILEYIPFLKEAGIEVVHHSLIDSAFYQRRQRGKPALFDPFRFAGAVLARAAELARRPAYDAVWVGRELMPYGPPLLERLLFRSGVPVVLDIDDALFEPDPAGGFFHRKLRDFRKYAYIAPRSRTVVVGNRRLAAYFSGRAPRVELIPTCVDHRKYAGIARRPDPSGRVRIGWIGTPANRSHLERIRGAVERLASRHRLEFRAVGINQPLGWAMKRAYGIPWELGKELEYFADFDIGVMPLADTAFTRGKCAFKMVQYMAAGLPVVASPVGANRETLVAGGQGFFAETPDEWETALETLIRDPGLRRGMGASGRERVRERYSLVSQWPRYADILRIRETVPKETL
ncbi:MAG: glycosyltransferase family 4 protein [Planctomycetota bacterium]|nr:glycosyltransferase family 4 protein [Planctomycetota bacterium]